MQWESGRTRRTLLQVVSESKAKKARRVDCAVEFGSDDRVAAILRSYGGKVGRVREARGSLTGSFLQ